MVTQKIKDIQIKTTSELEDGDVLSDPKYICHSCTVVTEALKRGCDVVQMPNGDIIIREQKIVMTKYSWNPVKEKIVKSSSKIEDETTKMI